MVPMSSQLAPIANRLKALPAGSVVAGKYRIDAVLAEGGMGVIYRGWHLVLDQPIAVKVMRPELAERPEAGLRFLNEARAAARLRGANVARVLDSGAIDASGTELLYIVLEYLEGADLRTVLEQGGALRLEQAVDFVLQACEALAEAHVAGIVHRDVKPENLFLTRQPDGSEIIKLLDFGISKRMDGDPLVEGTDGQSLGSPHYMAPEQMSSPGGVDMRADIWSLGIVLYELLTLRVPFDGDTIATVCAQVLGREPTPISAYCENFPAEVDAAVLGCLQKDREQRHAHVGEFANALARFGSAKATESLRRIQRIFEHSGEGVPLFEIDVELADAQSGTHLARRERSSAAARQRSARERSRSVDVAVDVSFEEPPQARPRTGLRVALAGAAAFAALALALPGGTTLKEMRDKASSALSPISANARVIAEHPAVQLSKLMPQVEAALPSADEDNPQLTVDPAKAAAPPPAPARPRAAAIVPRQQPRTVATEKPRGLDLPRLPTGLAPARPGSRSEAPAATAAAAPKDDHLLVPYGQTEQPSSRSEGESKVDIASSRYGLDASELASAGLVPAYTPAPEN